MSEISVSKLVKTSCSYFLIYVLFVVIHELGHWLYALLILKEVCSLSVVIGRSCIGMCTSCPHYDVGIYFAGGLFASLVSVLLYTKTRGTEISDPIIFVGAMNAIYGFFEGITLGVLNRPALFNEYYIVPHILSILVFVLWKFLR